MPEGQLRHAAAPATGENDPALQLRHVELLVAPVVGEKVPALHAAHDTLL